MIFGAIPSITSRFAPASTPVIGLDIGGRTIRAAQGRPEGIGREALRTARIERPLPADAGTWREPDATELGRLAAALARRGFEGECVRIAVPRSMLVMESLELPPRSSGAPIEKLARIELARAHRLSPDELECAVWDLPTPARGGDLSHVVACGIRRTDGERLAATVAAAGMIVSGIDLRSWSVARAVGLIDQPGIGARALIDIAWDACTLAVTHRGVLVFKRSVDDGALRNLLGTVAERLKIGLDAVESALDENLWRDRAASREDARLVQRESRQAVTAYFDAMVPEIARSLAYASQRFGVPITDLTLTGEGAGLAGLATRLIEQPGMEGVPVRAWTAPGAGSDSASPAVRAGSGLGPEFNSDLGPDMACAIGLASPVAAAANARRAA